MSQPDDASHKTNDDAAKAVKFLAIKAGIFILIPLLAAAIAVWVML